MIGLLVPFFRSVVGAPSFMCRPLPWAAGAAVRPVTPHLPQPLTPGSLMPLSTVAGAVVAVAAKAGVKPKPLIIAVPSIAPTVRFQYRIIILSPA